MKANKPIHTQALRFDQLTRDQITWIKVVFANQNPSTSTIVRRALAVYLSHLERIIQKSPTGLQGEVTYLRSAAGGDVPTWGSNCPNFSEQPMKPFSLWVTEANRKKVEHLLNSDPFGHKKTRYREVPLVTQR